MSVIVGKEVENFRLKKRIVPIMQKIIKIQNVSVHKKLTFN